MNLVPGVQRVTADIQVGSTSASKPILVRVFCVNLISGGSASTLILRNGTSASATAWEQVDGIASQSVTKNYSGGLQFPLGCFADVDASISYATVSFTEEF